MTAGELIKSKRERLGMTQEELSKKCGFKSRSSVNKIERISRGISLKRMKAIADVLGLDLSEIVEMSLEEQKRNVECTVDDFMEENDKSEKPEITHENTSESKNCITETSYVTDMLNVLSGIRDELHAIRECIENEKR